MKPKKESKREDISDKRSEKKGMTSAYIMVRWAHFDNKNQPAYDDESSSPGECKNTSP